MRSLLPRDARQDAHDVRIPTPASVTPATIVIHPEVLRTIAASCAAARRSHETGGPLIGTIQRSWEPAGQRLIASILGTVGPGPALQAGFAAVALGSGGEGERASSAIRWWRSVTELDLMHLGDWHRHPSGSPEPSGGDRVTAQRMASASPAAVWLTAIAVEDDRRFEEVKFEGHLAVFSRARTWRQEVRFYRECGRAGLVRAQVRIDASTIPRLPMLPWHVVDPVRFAVECRLLAAAGFRVAVDSASADRRPGVALRLRAAGSEGSPALVVVTDPRYPNVAPTVLDARTRKVRPLGSWSPARFLVDVVKEIA